MKTLLDFIVSHEGYHEEIFNGSCLAYPDVGSDDGEPWTIGFGTTSYAAEGLKKYRRSQVRRGDTLTREQALTELEADIAITERTLRKLNPNLTPEQFFAATSFFFNCGFYDPDTGGLSVQSLRIQRGELLAFKVAMLLYVRGANRKVLPGLVTRRKQEHDIFEVKGVDSMNLQVGSVGQKVQDLHTQLSVLGYLGKGDNGDKFTIHTQAAVKWFQRSNQLVSDGIVGPKTQAALDLAVSLVSEHEKTLPVVDYATLTIAPVGKAKVKPGWQGLVPLLLTIGNKGDEFIVCSGQAYAQKFRKPGDPRSRPGCMEPIPQGVYKLGNVDWAAGVGNYQSSWGQGLGPVWVAITATFSDDRSAFGFHLDAGAQGTAGCVGFHSIADLRRFVTVFERFDPKELRVQWGLS